MMMTPQERKEFRLKLKLEFEKKLSLSKYEERRALEQRSQYLNERIATFKKRLTQKKKGSWKYNQLKRKIKNRTEELKLLEMLITDQKTSDPFDSLIF
jgi:hypothetical protein